VVLPQRIYGLDVTVHVGERHLSECVSLAQVTRDLNERGLPIDQRHTGRVFRDFMALTALARGDEAELQARLREQGGIVLMCDGVQFEDRSPVLYMAWDAISGTPLFGERKLFRSESDLVQVLERVRAMNVPVVGIVTDKEKGLVPAVEQVFPGVPYQLCQTHFLKNCAKPLQVDASSVQAGVRKRAEAVRIVAKSLQSPKKVDDINRTPTADAPAKPSTSSDHGRGDPERFSEEEFASEICELVRVNSRVSGKAPFDPPELKRYERLEQIRAMVDEAQKKGGPASSNAHGRKIHVGPC